MTGQVVLLREFLAAFFGNELTLGFILPAWLLSGAAGTVLARMLVPRRTTSEQKKMLVAAFLVLSAVFFCAAFAAVRCFRQLLGLYPGEIVPLFPAVAGGLLILFPSCSLLGSVFTLSCSLEEFPRASAVYSLEAAGAACAGVITGFFLVRLLCPADILVALLLLNLLCAAWVFAGISRRRGVLAMIALGGAAICAVLFGLGAPARYDRALLAGQWKGYELCAAQNSIYGSLSAVKRLGETSFFENGLRLFTSPDRQSEEESVHYCLLEHPAPRSCLLIGAGPGSCAQALKHHAAVDVVQMDPALTGLYRSCLGRPELKSMDEGARLVINSDGRAYLKNCRAAYDCIILSPGDPLSCQLNRYYTAEFFREVKEKLTPQGVFGLACSGSDSYLNAESRTFLSCVYSTLRSVFPDVMIIPGENFFFIASAGAGVLSYDHFLLEKRLAERGIDSVYVSANYLPEKLSAGKIVYFRQAIDEARGRGGESINRDFRPVGCLYATSFWLSHFRGSLLNAFIRRLRGLDIPRALAAVFLAAAVFAVFLRRRPGRIPYWAAAASGFSMISIQVMVILVFQSLFGYIFYRLGLIMAAFMIGMALGGWAGGRMAEKYGARRMFSAAQAAVLVYSALLLLGFLLLGKSARPVGEGAFFLLPFCAGTLGGAQFTAITAVLKRSPGYVYGAELAGSCLGALVTSALLVPLLGIPFTAAAIVLLNAAILSALIRSQA